MAHVSPEMFQERARIMKALAHPSRLMMVDELSRGERCVCDLTEMVGADISTVSKHLSILKSARLVEGRKDGRWNHYQLSRESRFPVQSKLVELVIESIADSKQAVADSCALAKIREQDMDELCRKIAKKD